MGKIGRSVRRWVGYVIHIAVGVGPLGSSRRRELVAHRLLARLIRAEEGAGKVGVLDDLEEALGGLEGALGAEVIARDGVWHGWSLKNKMFSFFTPS